MQMENEEAADILEKITFHQSSPKEREVLTMGAAALRRLEKCDRCPCFNSITCCLYEKPDAPKDND